MLFLSLDAQKQLSICQFRQMSARGLVMDAQFPRQLGRMRYHMGKNVVRDSLRIHFGVVITDRFL